MLAAWPCAKGRKLQQYLAQAGITIMDGQCAHCCRRGGSAQEAEGRPQLLGPPTTAERQRRRLLPRALGYHGRVENDDDHDDVAVVGRTYVGRERGGREGAPGYDEADAVDGYLKRESSEARGMLCELLAAVFRPARVRLSSWSWRPCC